ncbi:MAG: threonine synthase, partial [Clostridia bacterium]|nr:threonine synthase [Clostridia bacterium]
AEAVNAYNDYLTETGDNTKTVVLSTASPYKFAHDVYESVSGNDEPDAFKAVKKLHSYTMTDIPAQIKELEYLDPIHTGVVEVKDIEKAIFAFFDKDC